LQLGVRGLRWESQAAGETREYSITVRGNVAETDAEYGLALGDT
jgi:hypothetical protein